MSVGLLLFAKRNETKQNWMYAFVVSADCCTQKLVPKELLCMITARFGKAIKD